MKKVSDYVIPTELKYTKISEALVMFVIPETKGMAIMSMGCPGIFR